MNNYKQKVALNYYLESVVPRGGVLCVFFPKTILTQLLPSIAKRKNCQIIHVGSSETAKFFTGVVNNKLSEQNADLFISEPVHFTEKGGLFHPEEAELLEGKKVFGVGISECTSTNSKNLDFVPLVKAVTELGVFSPEMLSEEINVFS